MKIKAMVVKNGLSAFAKPKEVVHKEKKAISRAAVPLTTTPITPRF